MAKKVNRGDPIRAADWNEIVAALGNKAIPGGHGGDLVAGLDSTNVIPGVKIRLVEAIARATSDEADVGDALEGDPLLNAAQSWFQRCRYVIIDSGTDGYKQDTEDDEILVFYPTHLRKLVPTQTPFDYAARAHVSWSAGYAAGERFWAIFNVDSGRWEALTQAREFCRIQLTTALTAGGTAQATVLRSNADHTAPATDAGTITVFDFTGASSGAVGDKGYAFRFTDAGRWEAFFITVEVARFIALCKTSNQAITTDVATKLTFQHSHNFSTANHTPFDAGAVFDGIELKRIGWYQLEYDLSWQGTPTSPGAGTDLQAKEGNITIGTSTNGVGTVTTATCSMMLATVAKLTDSDQSIAVGGCGARTVLFYNSAITNVAHVMITTCNGHTFAADCCEFRAHYLHSLTSTETTP